ncbi:General transcription factor 3C polypeptide 5 [Erysiphe neolycopersici]|uniref:General transcription factor 3C polypeptide 5 n=1 Tax=Erysiphe neolycopersici TaxID=212602 RepID=A0A420HGS3_9PEZI|nr:General transcription factor 3C polypeptide 5 [Erysiphe neolycopersici]
MDEEVDITTTNTTTSVTTANSYEIPPLRKIVAVEHPMIIKNLDNGIKTFGTNHPFERVINSEDPEDCVPLYLRYEDKMCVPILSRNTATNNILLKITVPKRTGRKRKRGSQDPFLDQDSFPDDASTSATDNANPNTTTTTTTTTTTFDTPNLRSQGRLDKPLELKSKLKDNVGRYTIEPVGQIRQTHRFRCLTDFHFSVANTRFYSHLRDTALTGEVENLRKFTFNFSKGVVKNDEIVPPPTLTSHPLPFNWQWHQNGNIFEEKIGDKNILVNRSKPRKTDVPYLAHDVDEIPNGPPFELQDDPGVEELVKELHIVLDERPIWTRRSLTNRLRDSSYLFLLRAAIQFVAYQFKGGPFRDAIIKYGIDPRKDPKYRKYQTFFFKLLDEEERGEGMGWHDPRTAFNQEVPIKEKVPSHIFDGKNLTLDGKVWQACDIRDSMLRSLIENSPYREVFDEKDDGWFCNGAIAKIKSIMKIKLEAIRTQKRLLDEDFTSALSIPDIIPDKLSREIRPALPDIRLTTEQMEAQRKRGKLQVVTSIGVRRRDIMGRIKRTRGWGHQTSRSESNNNTNKKGRTIPKDNEFVSSSTNKRPATRAASEISSLSASLKRNQSEQPISSPNNRKKRRKRNLDANSTWGTNDLDETYFDSQDEMDLEDDDNRGFNFEEADSSEHDEFPEIPSDVEIDGDEEVEEDAFAEDDI